MPHKKLLANVIYFLVSLAGVIVLFRFTNVFSPSVSNTNTNTNINQNVNTSQPIPSVYPDYLSIIGDQKDLDVVQLEIVKDFTVNHGAIEGDNTTLGSVSKKVRVSGEFSRIYLFFEGTIDGRPLSAFDDLYFKIQPVRGGHIVIDQNSLPVPPGETTKQLFSLESISYFPTIVNKRASKNEVVNANLLQYFKNGSTLDILAFISSERSPRTIKELSLYYECKKDSIGVMKKCEISSVK